MLQKLEKKEYKKVLPLLDSKNELSVYSVIDGIVEGCVYVNHVEHPTAALIQTSECNLIAGAVSDEAFNEAVAEEMDFWDSMTPDSEQWKDVIPQIHPDRFVRKYTRRHYVLDVMNWCRKEVALPDGYYLEAVELEKLKQCSYKNADRILKWAREWGSEENFKQYGVGAYIRNEQTIVSWSLSDCVQGDKAAIGIRTDEAYRRKGFAKAAANEAVWLCSQKGYKQVEWLCVDSNKGSIATAEKVGFQLKNKYDAFIPYAPIENLSDLSEAEWMDWAEYFEHGAKTEPRLLEESIYTYIKANHPEKVEELMRIYKNTKSLEQTKQMEESIKGFVGYLHSVGMASHFSVEE